MKQLLVIIALICSVKSFSQTDTALKFSDVVNVNATKEQLYQRARGWFNDAFKSSKAVLQIQDKETGELAGKGILYSYLTYGRKQLSLPVGFSVNIIVKDGKYKYTFQNLSPQTNNLPWPADDMPNLTSSPTYPKKWGMLNAKRANEYWNKIKASTETEVEKLITSLSLAMKTDIPNF